MTVAAKSLPWASLRLQSKSIPWSDLYQLADAVAESPQVREELIQRAEAEVDRQVNAECYDASDLTDVGAAVVFALAANRLDDEAKRPIADFLLRMLKRGSDTGVDYLEEAAERAAGRLGPVIIRPVIDMIESDRCKLHCWFTAFALLCVAEEADADTRREVIQLCRRMMRECPDRFESLSLALGPAGVLEALNDRESLPLLKATHEQSQDPELRQIIRRLEHGRGGRLPHAWHVAVEDWLPDLVEALREASREEERARDAVSDPAPAEPQSDPEDEANYHPDLKNLFHTPSQSINHTQEASHVPIVRNEPKYNRNELCPCGSGKKYKKCCGR